MALQEDKPNAFGSLIVICSLLLLSAIVLAWAKPFSYRTQRSNIFLNKLEEEKSMESAAAAVLGSLEAASSGDTEKMLAWRPPQGVSLTDNSRFLNPNWIRKQFFIDSPLRSFFISSTPDIFQAYRAKTIVPYDLKLYSPFFSSPDLARYFTVFSPLNINTVDEFVFENVMKLTLDDTTEGARWREKLRQLRLQGMVLRSETETKLWFGSVWEKVRNFVSWLPDWNINTLDPVLLEGILSYKDFGISSPVVASRTLSAVRSAKYLSIKDVKDILNIDEGNSIWQYLGTESSYWSLTLNNGNKALVIVFRKRLESPSSFQIISKRYYYG